MNELIEKLAEQAEQYVKSNPQAGVTIHGGDMFNKKFAELIVKECVEIADKSNQGSKSSNEGTEFYYNADIGDKIKEHFGVEE